jgi:transposase
VDVSRRCVLLSKPSPRLSESIGREGLIELAKRDPEAFVDLFLKLEARVCDLERRLAENSSNSSKPPSQDGAGKPPKSRSKSKRKSGGQKGHAGRHLEQVEDPDHIAELKLSKAPSGATLSDTDILRWETRQVFDLPEPKLVVTEYRTAVYRDPITGKICKKGFPEGVNASAVYGPGALTFMVYLHTQQHLPLQRIGDIFSDLFGHPVSDGTILKARQQAAIHLMDFEEELLSTLSKQVSLCCDETGLRVKEKLYWCHVACTEKFTYYAIHDRRGSVAFQDIGVLRGYGGNLIHDCLSSYDAFCPGADHGLCNAHVIRELTAVGEQGSHQSWSGKLVSYLYEANQEVKARGRSLTEAELISWNRRFDRLVNQGAKANPEEEVKAVKRGRQKRSKAQNLIKRLKERRGDYLRFMISEDVPFTNNLAERDLRMMKLQMKISGCFRTLMGAEDFGRIRSYISTMRKNEHNLFNAMMLAIQGNPIMPSDLLPE